MLGRHMLMSWSVTQGVVALSSGEAELYAMVKGAANTLGLISLAGDFGLRVDGRIFCDASAAIGIVNRTGVGRLRHVRVQYLWLQDKVRNRDLEVEKIGGDENPADLLTKHVPAELIARHCEALGVDRLESRAASAPALDALLEADSWVEDAAAPGQLVRHHSRWRRELFTPLRVEGSPPARVLAPVRVTEGTFEDGIPFKRVDSWSTRSTAHLALRQRWRGTTSFMYKMG